MKAERAALTCSLPFSFEIVAVGSAVQAVTVCDFDR